MLEKKVCVKEDLTISEMLSRNDRSLTKYCETQINGAKIRV